MKPKSFCTTKETINKVKRQLSDWEKIIANEATDKGLIQFNFYIIKLLFNIILNYINIQYYMNIQYYKINIMLLFILTFISNTLWKDLCSCSIPIKLTLARKAEIPCRNCPSPHDMEVGLKAGHCLPSLLWTPSEISTLHPLKTMRARSQVISKQCFSLHVSWVVISFVWGVRIVREMSLMYSPSARKQFCQGGKQQTSSSHLETFSSTGSSLECSGSGLNCGHQWGQRLSQRGQDLDLLGIKCHDSLLEAGANTFKNPISCSL